MRNERAWPQQCWKSCANGSNIVALRFSDHGTKEMLGVAEKFDRFQTLRNNTQQHPTTCNRVCKRTQHITSNNAGNCWPTMFRPFARGFTLEVNPVIFASCVYVKTFFFRSILSLMRFLFQTFDRI